MTATAAKGFVDFCGERYDVPDSVPLVIGREGPVGIDDNPYLHRRFLEIAIHGGLVWLTNVGSRLSATVADDTGAMQAWLSPGGRLPIVFGHTVVWFTAGPTTYEFDLYLDSAPFLPTELSVEATGETTIGRINFTVDQKRLLVAIAEPVLRGHRGTSQIPSSADAARRLGWTLTKFTRKLDNVCDKLTRAGIQGLRGDSTKLASGRRARLVEYSVAAHLVTVADLVLLPDRSA